MSKAMDMSRDLFCPTCEDYHEAATEERNETYTVRGEEIAVPVTRTVCSECGSVVGNAEQDQAILEAVHAAYRRKVDLLTPDRIKDIRKQYRLSQRSFAALLGMSEATVNRYENGSLQDATHDTAIRACEKPDVVRDLLDRRGHLLSDWQRKRVLKALAGQSEPDAAVIDSLGEIDWICMPREVSEQTGYRRFDYGRFAAVVAWFCNRLTRVSRTTINKLVFYADFLHFKVATVSLTGAAYRRLEYGPVPADYGGLLSRMESEGVLVSQEQEYPNGYVGFYYSPGPEAGTLGVDFTQCELTVLERVAESLGRLNAKAISERSHEESAWKDTEEKQLLSYAKAMELSLSLKD